MAKRSWNFRAIYEVVFVSQCLLSGYELIFSSHITDWTPANLGVKEKKTLEALLTKRCDINSGPITIKTQR